MLAALITEFGMKIMSGLVAFLLVIGGYLYWKHEIVSEALSKISAKSEDILKEKEEEATQAKKQLLERTANAIQIYSKHYDDLRSAADRIPERVYINTKNSCGSNAVSRSAESGSKTQAGIRGTGKAELPESNIRELNETIRMIEQMQLKCEYLLNNMP